MTTRAERRRQWLDRHAGAFALVVLIAGLCGYVMICAALVGSRR